MTSSRSEPHWTPEILFLSLSLSLSREPVDALGSQKPARLDRDTATGHKHRPPLPRPRAYRDIGGRERAQKPRIRERERGEKARISWKESEREG